MDGSPRAVEHFPPTLRGLNPGLFEDVGVVPPGRLVRDLEVDAIEGAVDRSELRPDGGEVLSKVARGLFARLVQHAAFGEVPDERGLRNHRHVRRTSTLYLGAQESGDVVARSTVARLDPGPFGEEIEYRLKPFPLRAGPDRRYFYVAAALGGFGLVFFGFSARAGGSIRAGRRA